jgi:hypothetical protein
MRTRRSKASAVVKGEFTTPLPRAVEQTTARRQASELNIISQKENELEILGAGFGRTGTNSLKIALERLGFGPCYHMYEITKNPGHISFWNAAASNSPVEWISFFKSYKATVDWPASAFVPQIYKAFKSSKVIITVRNPEEWYQSANNTIFHTMANWEANENPETRDRMKMAKKIILDGVFWGKHDNKNHCIGIFNKHINEISNVVPKDNLLIFDVSEGWVPLCEFLKVEIPNEAFPYTNTRASFFKHKPK